MHSQDQNSVIIVYLQYFVMFVRYIKSITKHPEKFENLYI